MNYTWIFSLNLNILNFYQMKNHLWNHHKGQICQVSTVVGGWKLTNLLNFDSSWRLKIYFLWSSRDTNWIFSKFITGRWAEAYIKQSVLFRAPTSQAEAHGPVARTFPVPPPVLFSFLSSKQILPGFVTELLSSDLLRHHTTRPS